MATPDKITLALTTTRQTLFQSIWTTFSSNLNLDDTAQIFTSSVEISETLLCWLKDASQDLPESITLTTQSAEKIIDPTLQKVANIILVPKVKDESITHAFFHVNVYSRKSLALNLEDIYNALVPQGMVLLACTKRNPVQEIILQVLQISRRIPGSGMREIATDISLQEMAEAAQFEASLVRIFEHDTVVRGEELKSVKTDVQTILDGAFGQQGDGQSWESIFENVWSQEVERAGGGLKLECWVLFATK